MLFLLSRILQMLGPPHASNEAEHFSHQKPAQGFLPTA